MTESLTRRGFLFGAARIMDFDKITALADRLVVHTSGAITLKTMCKRFNEDLEPRLFYEKTYEAHGFVVARSALDLALCLSLARLNDRADDVNSLPRFFAVLRDSTAVVEAGILDGRLQHVSEVEARSDTEDRMQQLYGASVKHGNLLGSHQWSRTKAVRNKFIAHSANETSKVQELRYQYVYELCDMTSDIVDSIASAILGLAPNFSEHEALWTDYSRKFLRSMMTGETSKD